MLLGCDRGGSESLGPLWAVARQQGVDVRPRSLNGAFVVCAQPQPTCQCTGRPITNDVNQAGDQSARVHGGCEAGERRELFRPERLVLAEGWLLLRFHI